MITTLQPNQILVVGTNANGMHGGGAAAQAHKDFGALMGCAYGAIGGQSYGIVTLDRDMAKVSIADLLGQAIHLSKIAEMNPEKHFLLTPIGTGIAGFRIEEIANIFTDMPGNIVKVGWK